MTSSSTCVKVPVLSEKMYSIWPSSSFRVVVLDLAGVFVLAWYILLSQLINQLCPKRIISTLKMQNSIKERHKRNITRTSLRRSLEKIMKTETIKRKQKRNICFAIATLKKRHVVQETSKASQHIANDVTFALCWEQWRKMAKKGRDRDTKSERARRNRDLARRDDFYI